MEREIYLSQATFEELEEALLPEERFARGDPTVDNLLLFTPNHTRLRLIMRKTAPLPTEVPAREYAFIRHIEGLILEAEAAVGKHAQPIWDRVEPNLPLASKGQPDQRSVVRMAVEMYTGERIA